MVVKKCATTKCNNFKRVACILLPCLFTKNVLHNTQKVLSILINQNLVVLVIYLENMQFMAFHTQLRDLI